MALKTAAREIFARHGTKIALPFWLSGNGMLVAESLQHHTSTGVASAGLNILASVLAAFDKRYQTAFPLAVGASVASTIVVQSHNLINLEVGAWSGLTIMALGSIPPVLEPWTQKKMIKDRCAAEWTAMKHEVTRQAKDLSKHFSPLKVIKPLAKFRTLKLVSVMESRPICSGTSLLFILPLLPNALNHNRPLFYALSLLLVGNTCAALSRPQASKSSSKQPSSDMRLT